MLIGTINWSENWTSLDRMYSFNKVFKLAMDLQLQLFVLLIVYLSKVRSFSAVLLSNPVKVNSAISQ